MAELFQRRPNHHDTSATSSTMASSTREATIRKFRKVRHRGRRGRSPRDVEHYNLDAIIAVGYRVRSHRGTQFRLWATARLREYLVKGFTMDDERLKNPPGEGQRTTSTSCSRASATSARRSGASSRRCSTSTRRASTTRRTPRCRSSSSRRCRTRCTGPRTATPRPRSFTTARRERSRSWAA